MGGLRPRGQGITSSTKIIANIFISFIGAGMLGLPFAFKEAGLVEGAVIMTLVGYLSTSSMLMLIDCKYAILAAGGRTAGRAIVLERKAPLLPPSSSDEGSDSDEGGGMMRRRQASDLTYGDVGLYAYGPFGKRLVDIAVVVSQIGFCCGYLIYICKNLSVYAPVLSQHQWLLLLLPPLYCLTLLRHLNKLAVFSLFAQVSNVFALAVVFWFDFSHSESVPFVPKEFSLKGLPFFFAVAIYCYEGAGLILSMEESVAEPKRPKFRTIFVCTMICLTVLYVCFGASGYLSFGPHTEDIITLNLPHGQGPVDFAALVKVCLGIALFFTYPMMMFPVTHLLDKTCSLHTTIKGNFVRLVVVCVSGLVVMAIPNFGVLISLIGATCCTLLAFILPALFHNKIFRSRLTKHQLYFNWLLVSLGVLGTIVGLWDTFNRMGSDALVTVDELSHEGGPLRFSPTNITELQDAISGGTPALFLTHAPAYSNNSDSLAHDLVNNASGSGNIVATQQPDFGLGKPERSNLTETVVAPLPEKSLPSSSPSPPRAGGPTKSVMSSTDAEIAKLMQKLFELRHDKADEEGKLNTSSGSLPSKGVAVNSVPDAAVGGQNSLGSSEAESSIRSKGEHSPATSSAADSVRRSGPGQEAPSVDPSDTAPRIRRP